jgi:hypothetical protein
LSALASATVGFDKNGAPLRLFVIIEPRGPQSWRDPWPKTAHLFLVAESPGAGSTIVAQGIEDARFAWPKPPIGARLAPDLGDVAIEVVGIKPLKARAVLNAPASAASEAQSDAVGPARSSLWAETLRSGAELKIEALAEASPVRKLACERALKLGAFAAMIDDPYVMANADASYVRHFYAVDPLSTARDPQAFVRVSADGVATFVSLRAPKGFNAAIESLPRAQIALGPLAGSTISVGGKGALKAGASEFIFSLPPAQAPAAASGDQATQAWAVESPLEQARPAAP